MSKLPSVSGKQCINALLKVGFVHKRQTGSHILLRRDDPFSQLVVPNLDKLDRGYFAGHHQASRYQRG